MKSEDVKRYQNKNVRVRLDVYIPPIYFKGKVKEVTSNILILANAFNEQGIEIKTDPVSEDKGKLTEKEKMIDLEKIVVLEEL